LKGISKSSSLVVTYEHMQKCEIRSLHVRNNATEYLDYELLRCYSCNFFGRDVLKIEAAGFCGVVSVYQSILASHLRRP
jgi:hypothetical protein